MPRLIHTGLLLLLTSRLLGCGGDEEPTASDAETLLGTESSTGGKSGDSYEAPILTPNFLDTRRFPIDLLISGPAKDGIPALTDPSFVSPTPHQSGPDRASLYLFCQ